MPVDPRRCIPRTDALLADPMLARHAAAHGTALVKAAIGAAQAEARASVIRPEDVRGRAAALAADAQYRPSTQRVVLNATGVVIHTNLGRAPLSRAAVVAVEDAAGYVDLEFDAGTGGRGRRGVGAVAAVLAACPAAESSLVVNNGAAALALAATTFAASPGADLLLSRGEMVEIGDGFRLPELIEATGVRIVEVGTTNRTAAQDYRRAAATLAAAGRRLGAILKVHPSNFRLEGFTAQASVPDLAGVAHEWGAPLLVDIGSGLLAPDPALPDEPDAATTLRAGADVVTCSGDKLLGGPQAGLALGRPDLVDRMRRHPLQRAFRAGKLTLAALEATLRGPEPPVTTYLHRTPQELRDLAEDLAEALALGDRVAAQIVPVAGRVGGGGAPGVSLPGWGVALPAAFAAELRRGDPLVVARVESGRCLLDPRCLDVADLPVLARAVRAAADRMAAQAGA